MLPGMFNKAWRNCLAAMTLLVLAASALFCAEGRMRLIIDTDAACERDDQHALAYALLSPELFEIEGLCAVHHGPGTLEKNFLEIHNILGLAGISGIPVFRGADKPLPSPRQAVESEAARFIVERAHAADSRPLVILGIGCATDLASAILLDSSIKERVTFAWLGGADWPNGKGGEHNSVQDIAAQRILFSSGAKLKYIPCGNNLLLHTRQLSARYVRAFGPLGDYLHLLMMSNRWPSEETFNIIDLAAVAALGHPELAAWTESPAPWIDEAGGYDWSRTFGRISVATNLVEDLNGGPRPVWDEFFRKLAEKGPGEPKSTAEELCWLMNIHPAAPDVAPVEGKIERFSGFTRQEVRWPTLMGQEALAYVCKPEKAGPEPLPALVCLSGTGGDRIVLTSEFFGIGPYARYGTDQPANRLNGWASELSRRGFVTLSLTQRGLGDRGRTSDPDSKEALLKGFTFQGIQAHEIRQAVTYLSRRRDVDSGRIGCTGMSFGGVTTFYSSCADPRIKVSAPLCGGVGSLRQMLMIGQTSYHGHYWWIPRILQHFDQGELAASRAPRPMFIAAPLDDIGMPREGVDEFLEKAAPAYLRAGAPDALHAYRPPGPHEFTLEMFEELVKFLKKYL